MAVRWTVVKRRFRRSDALVGTLPSRANHSKCLHDAKDMPARTSLYRALTRFGSGALVDVKDLEFVYAFDAGGAMTESSNYDGAPPVPPAYGIWRKGAPVTLHPGLAT